ncbi:Aspartate/glutamate/uridylate kinase domain protein, partial [mine drainage metagenome]
VVKLGGSVLTRKRGVEALRPKILARLAGEIATARDRPLVVLHGAGSFGHPGARRFGLTGPPEGRNDRVRGAAIVGTEVRRLHLAVLRALVAAGANPVSAPMATHVLQREGRPVDIDLKPFATVLERGAIPVAFGDVVPDDRWGFSILSADTLAVALATELRPDRVLFVSDVPGVLEPARPGPPRIYPELSEETLRRLRPGAAGVDVTGGIVGKVAAMQAIARAGIDAGLISGLSDGRLARALRGERVYGSWWSAGSR